MKVYCRGILRLYPVKSKTEQGLSDNKSEKNLEVLLFNVHVTKPEDL